MNRFWGGIKSTIMSTYKIHNNENQYSKNKNHRLEFSLPKPRSKKLSLRGESLLISFVRFCIPPWCGSVIATTLVILLSAKFWKLSCHSFNQAFFVRVHSYQTTFFVGSCKISRKWQKI